MRTLQPRQVRRGIVMAEAAIVSFVFLMLMLIVFDLGVCVFRQFVVSQAARAGARTAIVHGANAPTANSFGGPWGPSEVTTLANSNDPRAVAIKPMLETCVLSSTNITVQWLDGNNNVGSRVEVTISTPNQPILTSWLGSSFNLQASSTMLIAH